ncbi:MAG: phosphonopyruvate decarboxylase [Clostridiales bacterium]|jgi:phosphonopyruvate decarboxylase|nr:phosphonopyruvate decarboxylase [Clostridiales bacterium]
MVDTRAFYDYLIKSSMNFFVGVPDSLLKDFCSCVSVNSKEKNIIAANEGNAIAIASGYNISTKNYAVVYMQNSGLGNAINPILSLVDEEVYNIPMLMIIGWRGEPNVKDEPQHIKQGKVTLKLLDCIGVRYLILEDDFKKQIDYCRDYMEKTNKPIAIIVKKRIFSRYMSKLDCNSFSLTREKALEEILLSLGNDDYIVSTTGKTSREIFEIREKNNQNHSNDFLTVGSMGHASSIAFGISLGTDKNIYCIDGDGAFLMHMGGLAVAVQNAKNNFRYIMINNGCHDSVGGQPTIGFDINIKSILIGFGLKYVYEVRRLEDLKEALTKIKSQNKSALIVNVRQGSRSDLGRPSIIPVENKKDFSNKIRGF